MDAAAHIGRSIDAVVFDVIGTLVDESPAWDALSRRLAADAGLPDPRGIRRAWERGLDRRMAAIVREEEAWRSHRALVVEAAREAISDAGGVATDAVASIAARLDDSYPAWPDAAPSLAALRDGRLVTGLSNGDLDALARLTHTHALTWDAILSTGAVETFKPAETAYRYAIDALRLDPARTLFAAAHPWDLRAAAAVGFRTAYIARPGAERPGQEDRVDVAVKDVSALVDVLTG